MTEGYYQIKLCCQTPKDAKKLYNYMQGTILIEKSPNNFSIIAPAYDIKIDFFETWNGVKKNSVCLDGFTEDYGIHMKNIWNLIQAFKTAGEVCGVEIISCLIKNRNLDDAVFEDYYYPAPVDIANKLRENLDLSKPTNQDAYEAELNMIWGFGINTKKLMELLNDDRNNFICCEYDVVDKILRNAAKGKFKNISHYIKITADGIKDVNINLAYLSDNANSTKL